MSLDCIRLRKLAVLAYCGVLTEEVERRQPFEIDLDVFADLSEPGQTDELDNTIDYGMLSAKVVTLVETQRFSLLERLSQAIADVVLEHPLVDEVTVEVRKMRPPVPYALQSSGVRITRSR